MDAFLITILVFGILLAFIGLLVIISNVYIKKNKEYIIANNKPLSDECLKLWRYVSNDLKIYKEYIRDLGLNKIYNCSNSIVSNASRDEIKYLIKYSNLENSMECIEKLDFCEEFINLDIDFCDKMREFNDEILENLPVIIKLFARKERLSFLVCDIDWNFHNIIKDYFIFSYISPAGRSHYSYEIPITRRNISLVLEELYSKINKKSFSKKQRSTMTNDLREAIKSRDNYTCCICGNSVFKEPNLF